MNLFTVSSSGSGPRWRVSSVPTALAAAGEALAKISAEPPRDRAHGDVATNAAMVLAKPLGMKPRELALRIAARLEADPDVASVQVAGPGFVNLRLSDAFWAAQLATILRAGSVLRPFGQSAAARRSTSNTSRPTRPGRCMSAMSAARWSATPSPTCSPRPGYAVTREYYINDAGAQVDALARSAYLRYREALGEEIGAIPSGLYPGDYLKPVGEALKAEFGDDAPASRPRPSGCRSCASASIAAMMEMIRADLDLLGIHHDVFFSERSLAVRRTSTGSPRRSLR